MPKTVTKQENRLLEYVMVGVQFAAILFIGITTAWNALPMWSAVAAIICFGLGGYSILVMKLDNLHVLPHPVNNAEMVLHGPYRFIRHPMYASVLLTGLVLIAGDFSAIRLAVWLLLAVDLIVKLEYEEKLLILQFPAYEAYRKGTSRLIPFLY